MWHVYANSGVNIDSFFSKEILPSFDYLVYLFMIVSGFGMCAGYYEKFKNKQIDLDKFYMKRYAKILPFFALLIMADVLMNRSFESVAEGFMELTMVFGFLPNNQLSVIGVSWTLGVIFVFYITFPFFVFLLSNKKRAWSSFLISLVMQVLCAIYFMTDKFVVDGYSFRHSFIFCIPFFISGGLIYLYRDAIQKLFTKTWVKIIGIFICLFLTIIYYIVPHEVSTFSLNEIYFILIYSLWVIFAIGVPNIVFSNKFTKFISGISMEIYLSHMVFFRLVQMTGMISSLGNGWLAYILAVIVLIACMMAIIPLIQKILKVFSEKIGSLKRKDTV